MGRDIDVHDRCAVESMGAIQDRSCGQLATTDVAIIASRRTLREAWRANSSPARGGSRP